MTEPSASAYPGAVDTDTELGGDVVNLKNFTLSGDINSSVTSISATATISGVNTPFYALIDEELIYVRGTSGSDFTPVDRGAGGTTATTHSDGALIHCVYAANTMNQLKRAIIAVQTELGVDPAGAFATVVARLNDVDSSISGIPTDISDLTFTPSVVTDWDGDTDPGDADDAINQLAERVDDLEAAPPTHVHDAADVTYTPSVLTDWDGNADPGDTDEALDQLAERVDDLEAAGGGAGGGNPYTFQGRLTLTTGTPYPTAAVTGAGTVYLTPLPLGNIITLYDGSSAWDEYTLTELSLSLAGLTASKPHDIFVYDSGGGTLALEGVAWTDATNRATALTTQDGIYVKTGATARRYVGTIYVDSSNQCNDEFDVATNTNANGRKHIWNYYNRILTKIKKVTTTNHTYNSSTYRKWNNDNLLGIEYVIGVAEQLTAQVLFGGQQYNAATTDVAFDWSSGGGLFLDWYNASASAISGNSGGAVSLGGIGIGYHTAHVVEAIIGGGTGNLNTGVHTLVYDY